jgi:hypothetical protein
MYLVRQVFLAALVLSASTAWASGDISCGPFWAINTREYNHCSNVPFLSPGNDTRVNLKLLFVDAGRATLEVTPLSQENVRYGYGKVPFSLETFENTLFRSKTDASHPTPEEQGSVYGASSRCDSNGSGAAEFIQAVEEAKGLSPKERSLLIEARKNLKCGLPAESGSGAKRDFGIVGTILPYSARPYHAGTDRKFLTVRKS